MNTLVCRFALTLAVVRLLCSAPPAYADSFQLTYSGGALCGILNLTATPEAGGQFLSDQHLWFSKWPLHYWSDRSWRF